MPFPLNNSHHYIHLYDIANIKYYYTNTKHLVIFSIYLPVKKFIL